MSWAEDHKSSFASVSVERSQTSHMLDKLRTCAGHFDSDAGCICQRWVFEGTFALELAPGCHKPLDDHPALLTTTASATWISAVLPPWVCQSANQRQAQRPHCPQPVHGLEFGRRSTHVEDHALEVCRLLLQGKAHPLPVKYAGPSVSAC